MTLEFHPVANIFPMMSSEEYAELRADILANGLRMPIYTHEGKIVDGRNRYRACEETCTTPRFEEWDGRGSLVGFVVSLNLQRRHLTSSQKAAIGVEVEAQIAVEAKENQRMGSERIQNPIHAAEQAAKIVGTNAHYVADAKRFQRDSPALFEQIKSGELSMTQAKRELSSRAREKAFEEASQRAALITDKYRLINADFKDAGIAPNSIDYIITDPPYVDGVVEHCKALARFASVVLKDGGSCIVMVGQYRLPEVMARMSEHITYHWTLAYLTPGGQSPQIFPRKVNTFWKPLLWFVKGKYTGHWIGDVCKSDTNNNDKRFHHWGQSESGMADIVERFTLPAQTILDPFCGAGTTGVAAVSLDRVFIGIDSDSTSIAKAAARLHAI